MTQMGEFEMSATDDSSLASERAQEKDDSRKGELMRSLTLHCGTGSGAAISYMAG